MAAPRIIISGGSGFLGLSLARHLAELDYTITILSRHVPRTLPPNTTHQPWDARSLGPWADSLNGAGTIVNLTGRTVDCIKTPDHCDEILRSRVESTRVLGRALAQTTNPPPVWVQMSTAHIYGDPPEAIVDEQSAFGHGLAPDVGRAWESAFHDAALPSQRKVILRTSFVIGRKNAGGGGALARLSLLTRCGLGGKVGHGRQGMSWIHERDMNRVFERAITDDSMHGSYIATAPNPVSQAEFMRSLRRALNRPFGLPAPAPLVRIGAPLLMRTDPELALYGRYCIPKRLEAEGFTFEFPLLPAALADLTRAGQAQPHPS